VVYFKKQSQLAGLRPASHRENPRLTTKKQCLLVFIRGEFEKTKPISRALPGNPKHQALNPKYDDWSQMTEPKAYMTEHDLKKQSQFGGCSNERKACANKELWRFLPL
jgi:hypothetical protein